MHSFSIVGYPKCGNTWIHHIVCLATGISWFKIHHTHAMPEFNERSHEDQSFTFESLLPSDRIVVLVRHLGDVLVSLWFHNTRREDPPSFVGNISEMVRDDIYGWKKYIRYHQELARMISDDGRFMILRYFDAVNGPSSIVEMMKFIGFDDENIISDAISQSSFDEMKRKESSNFYCGLPTLEPPASGDPEGMKVRRGKVGGYIDYMNEDDIDLVEKAMSEMPDVYGYNDENVFLSRRK